MEEGITKHFENAYRLVLRYLKTLYRNFPSEDVCEELKERVELHEKCAFHGMGRSRSVAYFVARSLSSMVEEGMLGDKESRKVVYPPNFLPRRRWDGVLLFSFSGSGETLETVRVAESAKEEGASVVGVTSSRNSTLYSTSDLRVLIPGKSKKDTGNATKGYYERLLMKKDLPLGTTFEIGSTYFFASFLEWMKEGGPSRPKEIFRELYEEVRGYFPDRGEVERLYEYFLNDGKKRVVVMASADHSGLLELCGKFFAIRASHLGRNAYFYRDCSCPRTNEGDLVVVFGDADLHPSWKRLFGRLRREKGVRIVEVKHTREGNVDEEVSDLCVNIPRGTRDVSGGLRTLTFCESFLYGVASKEGVREIQMKERHSEFS